MDDMTERTLSRQNTSMSAHWQDVAEMGSGSEVGDATPLKRPPEEAAFTPRPLPQRPFGLGLERLPAAHRRAGLAAWAEDSATLSVAQVCGSLCTGCWVVAANLSCSFIPARWSPLESS